MNRIYPVTIDGETYGAKTQTDQDKARFWQKTLREAHAARLPVYCTCKGRGARQLAIRHFEDPERYFLARYPDRGEEHAADCAYYAANPERSGRRGYGKGVIEEAGEGLRIRLATGLQMNEHDAAGVEAATIVNPLPAGQGQAAMSLLGLLHLLWEEARLNVWWPKMAGKRGRSLVHNLLRGTAEHILSNGRRLAEHFIVCADLKREEGRARRNHELVDALRLKKRRLVIAGELATWERMRKGADGTPEGLLAMGFSGGLPKIWVKDTLWRAAQERYPAAWRHWQAGGKVILIGMAEPRGQRDAATMPSIWWAMLDLALMPVTEAYIPFDSAFERQIAEQLAVGGRGFRKPLRYDADRDVVFPDFELLDMGGRPVPMEVFGRTDEAYEARARQKADYYASHYGVNGWWCWNAARNEPVQEFPGGHRQQKKGTM